MKEIKLSQGYVALVDDEDFEYLNQWEWHVKKGTAGDLMYAERTDYIYLGFKKYKSIIYKMHRVIMNAEKGIIIDHINHDGLDNRKVNLRSCTHQQNSWNAKCKNKHGLKGVAKCKNGKYQVYIHHNGIHKYLGLFSSITDAAIAYDNQAKILYGEYANLNFKDLLQ